MSYKVWIPELVFSAHNTETKLKEVKLRTAQIISTLAKVPIWVLGNAGLSSKFILEFIANLKQC